MRRTRIVSIELKNVSLNFEEDGPSLIDDVSLKLPLGKNLVIEGGPGTGKSLLLKIMAGLHEPTKGDVLYNNLPLREMSFETFVPIRMSTTVCFENGGLLMNKSLLENLQLALFYHDQWRADRSESLLDDLTDHFQIKKFLHLRPSSVSSGIRKLAGLVKAFLSNAQILFLDEPSQGLGEAGCEALKVWLEKFEKTRKPDELIVMCSNDRAFLKNFDCQTYQVNGGKLHLLGEKGTAA